MRILIVEDDAVTRQILQVAINHFGYESLVVVDALEGWEIFAHSVVDVIISDWVMPGMDGLEFCRRVRAHQRDEYVYFIFLTALADKAHLLSGIKAGADDYLTKPIDLLELRLRLLTAQRINKLNQRIGELILELDELRESGEKN